MVTTESVPGHERSIVYSRLRWSTSGTLNEAFDKLREKAAEDECNAVVGIRIVVNEVISNQSVYEPVKSSPWFYVYGTAIRYRL